MAQITHDQRAALRQRLLAWASAQEVLTEETLAEQIDQLLQEVLSANPLPEPLRQPLAELAEDQRVVVTGMGLVTPFGIGIAPFWQGLTEGRSPVRRITFCDPSDFPCQIAAAVPDFRPQDFLGSKEGRRMSRASQFAVAAAQMALNDAHLRIDQANCYDVGTLIACGGTSMADTEQAVRTMLEKGPTKVSPFYIPMALPNMAASQVAIELGIKAYTSAISTACAAGAQAIGEAAAVIRRGAAEIMVAGGTEAPLSQLGLASFCAMRALSTHNADPQRASRPFDLERNGFVPGEGAGILILERLTSARRRRAPIYAELVGYASTCDAYHITAPEPNGDGAARAIRQALFNANTSPQQVDYINAHATSTPAGDLAETKAIKQVFGEYAYSVPISAPKSMIGHLTGASGAVEAAASILTIKHNLLPPTINQEKPDPACDLDYIPNVARPADVQTVISNSFGFGGVNAVLVFRRFQLKA